MRRLWRAGWACVALGCTPGSDAVTDTDTDTDVVDTDVVDTDTDVDTDAVDTDVVDTDLVMGTPVDAGTERSIGVALEGVFAGLTTFDNEPVELAWAAMRDRRILGCNVYTPGDTIRLEGSCSAPDGRRTIGQLERTYTGIVDVDGVSDALRLRGRDFANGRLSQGWATEAVTGRELYFFGMFYLADDDGTVGRINGTFDHVVVSAPSLSARRLFLGGPVEARDAGPTTWSGRGLVPQDLEIVAFSDAEGGVLQVSGSVGGLGGTYDTFTATNGAITRGMACDTEPAGTWSVRRRADAHWFDVVFNPERACDGCGRVMDAGAVVGTVCVTVPQLDTRWAEDP
ncbi:MAG: hypothetical protein H6733_17035 [Alphaproteobacteria bacterium]|nr:hypothetical protein [Alphaproteobacteria bacterium]